MNKISTIERLIEGMSIAEKATALNMLADAIIEESKKTKERIGRSICFVPIEKIHMFTDYPFYVDYDEEMEDLVRSISQYGQITPGTVRMLQNGEYQLLSGHRRLYACRIAGVKEFLCEVLDLSDDDACRLMIEANRQRFRLKPCEKGCVYRLKKELIEREKGMTVEINEKDIRLDHMDRKQIIKRLLRLDNLIPELREMVDESEISLSCAYEISFLSSEHQSSLIEIIDYEQCVPSHEQSIRMKKLYAEGLLTPEIMGHILKEKKPNQKAKLTITDEWVISHIPGDLSPKGQEEYIEMALKFYENNRRM